MTAARPVTIWSRCGLSADFANVIDSRTNYMVFITPEGDNRGVYVADITHAGFSVHESQGGRSTLMFSNRIVANSTVFIAHGCRW
jgi:hypothetical protein